MIINEECYQEVKNSLEELKAKSAESGAEASSLHHEIEIRTHELELYDGVVSGRYPLPELERFKDYFQSLAARRVKKGISVRALADNSKGQFVESLRESQIIAFELLDYLPATFAEACVVSVAIDEISSFEVQDKSDFVSPGVEENFSQELDSLKRLLEKQLTYAPDLAASCFDSSLSVENWRSKIRQIKLNPCCAQENSSGFVEFGTALNMWRVAKKWSYRQLAAEAGIDWLQLWHFEKTGFHGALIGTMYRLAAAVQKEHAPSQNSFDDPN